ncbi:MAG: cysteine desulfurase [bacterium]|nr:cysteine desulfurase [bacterium]
MIDLHNIRKDFPILESGQLAYLDSSNTSLTPLQVTQAMDAYYHQYNANIHRAVYPIAERATEEYENAREKLRAFIGAESVQELVFTRNATEAINLVARTWGTKNLGEGDLVVLSIMEHHSNIVPWQMLQVEKKFQIHFVSLTEEGRLDMSDLKKVLESGRVKLVALSHKSNVLGVENPVQTIVQLAHEVGAKVLLDGSQAVPHLPVDVREIGSDFYAFTGHKMCGPTGIGVLYAKRKLLEAMPPFLGGGEMIRTVETSGSTWNDLPYKFEAGTQNIAGAIGLGAAVDYLQRLDMKNIQKYEQQLLQLALQKLQQVKGLRIFGPLDTKERGAAVSFELKGIHPHDLATILGERGVCVRAGHHCAMPLMKHLQVPATTRMSLYFYNTEEEIDRLIRGIEEARRLFS